MHDRLCVQEQSAAQAGGEEKQLPSEEAHCGRGVRVVQQLLDSTANWTVDYEDTELDGEVLRTRRLLCFAACC